MIKKPTVIDRDSATFNGKPHAWIQYKWTDLCADIRCSCGVLTHVDADFAYQVKCGACGKLWALSMTVEMYAESEVETNGIDPVGSSTWEVE